MNRSATILIVEDDQSMLDGMNDLLEIADIGYDIRVLQANNGRAALAVLEQTAPDLIISDVMMPHMNGYELLQHVRDNPDWVLIPFIFVTAKGEEIDIRKGRLSDADLYITKPFVIQELLELIHTQLDLSFERQHSRQQHIESLKKNILQILNHEFRTPLTYVTAYYEMLAESVTQYADSTNYREYLRGIQAGCVRLTHLVDDFITVMALRSGEAQVNFNRQARRIDDLDGLIKRVVSSKQDQARQKNIQIQFLTPDQLPAIFGMPQSICDIADRLIDNAIKFTEYKPETPSTIQVSLFRREDEVCFTVKDEGVGLPQQARDEIFEPFVQYNREQLEQQGAGTGLTIAQGLAELHQGRILVESEEGEGSQFTVCLPIHLHSEETDTRNNFSQNGRKKATILIVEDDENLLIGLEELLLLYEGKYKFDVMTANNGLSGLAILEKQTPDLIISDIMMPKMGGYQFLNKVRENPAWVRIPFIFLTAKGEKQDEYEGFRRGVDEYISKPYDSEDMIRYIVKQLDRHFHSQSILAQNFDSLKRSIINLIGPNFRVPLASVSEYSDKLSESLQDVNTDEDLVASLRGIQAGSLRLTNLIEDFISLAELKTGEATTAFGLRAQPIANFPHLLYEVSQEPLPEVKKAGWRIHCSLEGAEEFPTFMGDSTDLLEAVERLIKLGAAECQPSLEKDIFLTTDIIDDEIHISIRFTAVLSQEKARKFKELLASEEIAMQDMPEYATSLHICQGYAQLHDGAITLQNEPPQQFVFTLIIPLRQEPLDDALN